MICDILFTLLVLLSYPLIFWSFKTQTLFLKQSRNVHLKFWQHENSDVCPLGHFGAGILILWLTLFLVLYWTLEEERDILGYVNAGLGFIIFVLVLLMNFPLFVRSIPLILILAGLSAISICNTVTSTVTVKE